ncbi:hypothetical protein GPECTOR_15g465 [Gonium pectorale]|uniref:Guanylate cyclase domain-containing protein n=1 Tax=Gonium pectorale TaxID=33097 RepID=A0A150GN58_GONPE|nr:hypothetical protein GPECTOR_15g465 [Gonium pectorale]|eukprot:KXZ50780.1 hypothetical protein GPECTOR_15g465 [Gonium pectorale]
MASLSGAEPFEEAQSSARLRPSLSRLPPQPQDPQQPDAAGGQDGFVDFKAWPSRLRSQTSFRTRLRNARRDGGGGAVSLFEWETRGHFWSALDKAAAPADPSKARKAGRLSRWRKVAAVRIKNTLYVIALRPSVLLWPLLLLGACIGLGMAGVVLGANSEASKAQSQASSLDVSPLWLAPCGVVRAVQPGAPQPGPQPGSSALDPAEQLSFGQLQTVLYRSSGAGSGAVQLSALEPVLVPGASAGETWGNDADASGNCSALPGGGGFDPRDGGTKLWGFVGAALRLGELADAGLSSLAGLGYGYRLLVRSGSDPASPLLAELAGGAGAGGGSGVAAPVPADSGSWQLQLSRDGGWIPTWKAPLTAVVIVASLALAGLLMTALVIQQRHRMLLGAMLPDRVVRTLGKGRNFYERYDNVTVLYADIVRYSNAPTGSRSWEVITLLNDVNNIFDSLLEKHGLLKIQRSGEAFMGVGGCPEAGDPIATAVRVALCAREMVMEVARYRSANGQRVQIRLGMHSGPVVAAVVGSTQPRFSLFGEPP